MAIERFSSLRASATVWDSAEMTLQAPARANQGTRVAARSHCGPRTTRTSSRCGHGHAGAHREQHQGAEGEHAEGGAAQARRVLLDPAEVGNSTLVSAWVR